MKKISSSFLTIFLVILYFSTTFAEKIDTFYGSIDVDEPIIHELINHPAMQRLKKIHQYGVFKYVVKGTKPYSRYDHSLGVFALLRLHNAPLNEQIAGLLHDVSHTVFSHVGDFLFNNPSPEDSYQDRIHLWFIQECGLKTILDKYDISLNDVSPEKEEYRALEQELPDMCADRIEYNTQGGYIEGLISKDDVQEIISDIQFDGEHWFFTNPQTAKKFADVSLYMTENQWGAAYNLILCRWTAETLQKALDIDLISFEDIHFSTDDAVWETLNSSDNEKIQALLTRIINYNDNFQLVETNQPHDISLKGKFRGVNPIIKTPQQTNRLTQLDPSFNKNYLQIQQLMKNNWNIKIK